MNHDHRPDASSDGEKIEVPDGLQRRFSKGFPERHNLKNAIEKLYAYRQKKGLEEEIPQPENDYSNLFDPRCFGHPTEGKRFKNLLR